MSARCGCQQCGGTLRHRCTLWRHSNRASVSVPEEKKDQVEPVISTDSEADVEDEVDEAKEEIYRESVTELVCEGSGVTVLEVVGLLARLQADNRLSTKCKFVIRCSSISNRSRHIRDSDSNSNRNVSSISSGSSSCINSSMKAQRKM
jgi:hypothetical protein